MTICAHCRRLTPTGICLNCASQAEVQCKEHKVFHLYFDDGYHACPECIQATIADHAGSDYQAAISRALPAHKLPAFLSLCDYFIADRIEDHLRLRIAVASIKHNVPVVEALARACNGDLHLIFPDLAAH